MNTPVRPTCKTVISIVAQYYGIRKDEIPGLGRSRYQIKARRMACVACQRILRVSTTRIGRVLNRDHSTVCHHLARSREPGFNWSDFASIEKMVFQSRHTKPVDNEDNPQKLPQCRELLVHYDSR